MSIPKASRRKVPNRKLQSLRINAGLSPNQLGYRAGVTGKTVRAIEDGTIRIPTARVQFQVAEVFGLLPLDLWSLESQDRTRAVA